MTSSSTHLVERARELVASGASADERIDALVLRGRLPSADAQVAWLEFADDVPPPFSSLQVYNPALGGDLVRGDDFDPMRDVIITLGKPVADGCAFFVFQSGIPHYLAQRAVLPRLAIVDFNSAQAFHARGLEVAAWDLAQPVPPPECSTGPIDPSRYVRDFVPDREIVTDLNPWMLVTAPAASSPAYQAWEAIAARRLLGGLVSRAWLEDGQVWLQAAATPPIYRIKADDSALPGTRSQLTEAASWVFLSGTDIEARHLLFSGELARARRPQQDLATTLDQALEAAKAAYEAHVQSSSRETLKALADLRKTVIDETQKVAQRAQDLAATLWRDLAVSAAPFVLKILGDATKTPDPIISSAFYFAAAGFIGLSFSLQWRINGAFFQSQAASRRIWMQSLYSYISVREREEIAETPIDQAMKNYRETHGALLVVYGLLIVVLIAFGVHALQDVTPSASNPAASVAPSPAAVPPPPAKLP
ncbi:hypothetical protein NB311A_13251 [Nitrobacter sp. Nb-311A]|uniref:hypothetical protein n=1 Tax=Nitrobacter sp. Nb-311A TaxID=314253 RepID=UPI0000684A34|nr:hypothetical protein [Nitrobacter sp. Nb-311A]EAQ35285.1 hypothetical protein NB311A_13251 [Nitrobacter sp. Nb-311A]